MSSWSDFLARSDNAHWILHQSDVQICTREDGSRHRLGKGGFGEVYKALIRGVQPVALKLFTEKDAGDQVTAIQLRELQMLKDCHSAYVVQFLGALLFDGHIAIVTELMAGGDLFTAMHGGVVSAWNDRALQIAIDVAMGLDDLHSRSIVHLDLKSLNILLCPSLRAKIADVGQSRMLTRKYVSNLSSTGTWNWTAPEVLLSPLRVNTAADMFSFGVVLLELATGEDPLRGQYHNILEAAPAVIQPLIEACMDCEPANRPTANQAAKQLLEIQRGGTLGPYHSASSGSMHYGSQSEEQDTELQREGRNPQVAFVHTGEAAASVRHTADAALPPLISLLKDSANSEGRIQAAAALSILAHEYVHKKQIAEETLPALVSLLQDSANPRGSAQAAGALRNMAGKGRNHRIADAALPALVSLLQDTGNADGRTNAAAALDALAQSTHLRAPIAEAALPALVDLLEDLSMPQGRIWAAAALSNLARSSGLQVRIAFAALPALVGMLRDANQAGVYQALGVLWYLALNRDLRKPIADAALPAMVGLLKNAASLECQIPHFCIVTLEELASHPDLRKPVADAASSSLVSLLTDPASDKAVRWEAAKLLKHLARSRDLQQRAQSHVAESFCELATRDSDELGKSLAQGVVRDLERKGWFSHLCTPT
ncbi:hypothetical protein WJX73_008831 [Symbiochloris irregularis]|uniref:Protein kinase domain-containing protein n=1 Tax=Symbiochloris irregularis TaxID=706552 RepID=A0AAW1NYK0_9CHLO